MERHIKSRIISDLKKKMVLLSGPRRVGKSFLATMIMEEFNKPRYLNWDSTKDRKVIMDEGWSTHTDLLVLDEIHKMASWKNLRYDIPGIQLVDDLRLENETGPLKVFEAMEWLSHPMF